MREQYDFSKAVQGRFYRGHRPFQVTVNVSDSADHPRYEVFMAPDGKFSFRLTTDTAILLTSDQEYDSKEACFSAIDQIRQAAILASTVLV